QRFIPTVREVFANHDLRPGQLKIELTERGLIKDTSSVIAKMQELIELGCEFMIDDFGTGYSSLSYLHELPISTLKIDRSFVINMEDNESSVAVIKTIVAMAQSLGLKVVAEGVETSQHVSALAALNSPQLQGYYFARPMPFKDVVTYLAEFDARAVQRAAQS
ncbi:MAG: EAL domain-containing protein, partial [Pseudomonadales bacterium]